MDAMNPLGAVLIVFALLGGVIYRFGGANGLPGMRRGKNAGSVLARRGSLRLTPQHSIHLVEASGRSWLLACHTSGVTPIAELNNFEHDLATVSKVKGAAI